MSEISSGLVAFCYMSDQYEVALFSEPPTDPLYDDMFPFVRLSDAEAIIAQKDAEIIEQCRINGMGAERELALRGQMERQAAMAGRDYEALRAVHCVAWSDMWPELTTMVKEKCFELLGIPASAIESVCRRETPNEKAHEPAKRLSLAFWRKA